ncbi:hypothetical protein LAZ40_05665 [Cereibacter sphaeroides]|uniref:hypothetical protein n=1 Tax=Cereibacter sphaeroides TaxID=1063 RepID=UPI001F3E0532|nr:hypothetical protein [Cereibacter sphaeroides]MCE6958537.1 hypothetical protein [Cereibacter sphaeroides]MCE6972800.1 hypothetical protein [Cereibacter sphaeroides]
MLRDCLRREFHIELPIRCGIEGAGEGRHPILIESSDPLEIGEVAYRTVTCLQKRAAAALKAATHPGHRTALFWRSLGPALVLDEASGLHRFSLERRILSGEDLSTEILACHFSLPETVHGQRDAIPRPRGIAVAGLSQPLPEEIGWLKLDRAQTVDYGEVHGRPDLGVGVAYGTTAIKATVYVYPAGGPSDGRTLAAQFERAAADVERGNPGWIRQDAPWASDWRHACLWSSGNSTEASILTMAAIPDHLLKVRVSWFRHRATDEIAHDFIGIVDRLTCTDP